MHKSYRLLFLMATFYLAGCVPIYQTPTEGPIAYISAPKLGFLKENAISWYQNPYACTEPVYFGNAGRRLSGGLQNIKFAANQFTTITVAHVEQGNVLNFTLSFIPQQGYSYIVRTTTTGAYYGKNKVTSQLLAADPKGQANNHYYPIP